jgi:hypothetical protein
MSICLVKDTKWCINVFRKSGFWASELQHQGVSMPLERPFVYVFVRCNFSCSGQNGFICPPRFMSVCCLLFVCLLFRTDGNCNFQPCAVQLSWNLVETLGWYPRLACMFWFQDSVVFHIVNKQKNKKTRKSRFYKTCVFFAMPSPIDLKLGGDIRTKTRNSVVCLFCLYYCLFIYRKHKQRKHTL